MVPLQIFLVSALGVLRVKSSSRFVILILAFTMREGALWLAKAWSESRLNWREFIEVFPLLNVVLDLLRVLVLFLHLARVKHRLPKAQQD